jgi:apolipoprotein N-acyltransferase
VSLSTRQWLAAACTGVLLALAFPYPDLHALVWVALVPLIVAVRGASPWQRWWAGLLAGFVWRAASLYWIAHVMHEYGDVSLPIGVAIAGLLALWMALSVGLIALLVPSALAWRGAGAVALAAAWVGLEYLQVLAPFGFPWSLLGYAAGRAPALMQAADIAGVWGLSLLAVFVNAAVAQRIVAGRRALPVAAVAAVLLVAAASYGAVRLAQAPPLDAVDGPPPAPGALRVAAVQGNVDQGRVWEPAELRSILEQHVSLSLQATAAGADLLIWSESSVPVPGGLQGDPSTREMLAQLARQHDVAIVVGSPHFERDDAGRVSVANSAFLVSADGTWLARYDKVRLVPFGEYVPLAWLFRFVAPLVEAVAGFRRGEPDQPLFADPAAGVPPFAMAICYEVVFPELLRRQVAGGATFLATITNDAWFGDTSAPYQHFSMARLRAVENRRYLVRAANTGISGVVDPWGRVVAGTEVNVTALVEATIVPREGGGLYAWVGDWLARLCVVLGGVAAVLAGRRRRSPPLADPSHFHHGLLGPMDPEMTEGQEKER